MDVTKKQSPNSSVGCGLVLLVGIGLFFFIDHKSNQDAERDKKAEAEYRVTHPLTETEKRANAHFTACWETRHNSLLSDNQRNTLLTIERCYDDIRDDPQQLDASYPINPYAPHPWKKD